ncbi:MAG: restriction endonuclease subunit S [Burkholderiales bacterium]|nr:restriction endonuclease subunit S [Burkholderiales bacterium]
MTWPTTRLRYVADLNPSVRADLCEAPNTEVSFLPMEAIGEDGSLNLDRVRPVTEVRTGYSYFEDGDVVFAKVTPCFENGKGALMQGLEGGAGFGTSELTVLRPRGDTLARFLHYVVQSEQFRQSGAGAMTGAGGLKRVPDNVTRDFTTSWPKRAEQERIANFLDDKTARIDALIGEKERLLEILVALRHDAIDDSVLGRDVADGRQPLHGLEVHGGIPVGWTSSRMKFELEYVTSGSRGWAEHYSDDGALFVRIGNLTRDSVALDLSDSQRVTPPDTTEGMRARVYEGDLLISITAYLGSVAVAPAGLGEAYVSQHVSLARPNRVRADPKWLGYVVLSTVGRIFFDLQAYGGTKVQLSLDDIRELPVPLPDLTVQRERIEQLEAELCKLDELARHTREHIALLREYRASLISAAVTGQLDINHYTAS